MLRVEPLLDSDLETDNETTIVGNKFLISKYARPLSGDAFEDRHVPMEMFGVVSGPCQGVTSEMRFNQSMKRRLRIWCEMAASLRIIQRTAVQSLRAVPARSW
jgi:hypothetical protein